MFLTKSSPSFLLCCQSLLITSLLLTSCLSYEIVDMDTLSKEDKSLVRRLFLMNKSSDGLISSNVFGNVYIYPDDHSKEARIYIIHENQIGIMDETEITEVFSNRDKELAGNPRLTPTLHRSLFIHLAKDNQVLVILIFERFRGNLTLATEDPRFIYAMLSFNARMEFYTHMMDSFGQIAKLKWKHCWLVPENISYKENNADWETDYIQDDGPLTYFPVIKGFKLAVPWDQSCKGASPNYSDPEEYVKEVKYFDNDKAKVELYSMALIMLYMETAFYDKIAVVINTQDGFEDKLKNLSGQSKEFAEYIGNDSAFSNNTMGSIFQGITKINKAWNQKKLSYSHDKLKSDIGFIISGMNLFFEFWLKKQGANATQIQNMMAQYKAFTDTLLNMLKKNNVTVHKRPSSDEVILNFTQIRAASLAIEATIGARRSLVLI